MLSFEALFGCIRLHPQVMLFCDDPKCECHENQFVISILEAYIEEGLLTPDEASYLVAGKTL